LSNSDEDARPYSRGAIRPGIASVSPALGEQRAQGRPGFTTGPVLFYATGGLALANDLGFFPFLPSTNAASASETRAGWTVGGGAEWMIAPKWSVKAEYLYVDLGNTTYTSINNVLNVAPNIATIIHDHRLTENIGRVGFNYKFGN
jgi:outer membrane immunogenic protein